MELCCCLHLKAPTSRLYWFASDQTWNALSSMCKDLKKKNKNCPAKLFSSLYNYITYVLVGWDMISGHTHVNKCLCRMSVMIKLYKSQGWGCLQDVHMLVLLKTHFNTCLIQFIINKSHSGLLGNFFCAKLAMWIKRWAWWNHTFVRLWIWRPQMHSHRLISCGKIQNPTEDVARLSWLHCTNNTWLKSERMSHFTTLFRSEVFHHTDVCEVGPASMGCDSLG